MQLTPGKAPKSLLEEHAERSTPGPFRRSPAHGQVGCHLFGKSQTQSRECGAHLWWSVVWRLGRERFSSKADLVRRPAHCNPWVMKPCSRVCVLLRRCRPTADDRHGPTKPRQRLRPAAGRYAVSGRIRCWRRTPSGADRSRSGGSQRTGRSGGTYVAKRKRKVEGAAPICDGMRCGGWACDFVVSPETSIADPFTTVFGQCSK